MKLLSILLDVQTSVPDLKQLKTNNKNKMKTKENKNQFHLNTSYIVHAECYPCKNAYLGWHVEFSKLISYFDKSIQSHRGSLQFVQVTHTHAYFKVLSWKKNFFTYSKNTYSC